MADINLGPGSLALYLGSEPGFTPETIWFSHVFKETDTPESLPPLRFDPENRWWKMTETQLRQCRELAADFYMVGCPDLVEGLDILATLREPQTLLVDMIERPEWVESKLAELNRIWFEVYDRIYDLIKLPDDSSAFWACYVWGPGRTAKVQCDLAAMISPDFTRGYWFFPSLIHSETAFGSNLTPARPAAAMTRAGAPAKFSGRIVPDNVPDHFPAAPSSATARSQSART